jgi:hypothetical protein
MPTCDFCELPRARHRGEQRLPDGSPVSWLCDTCYRLLVVYLSSALRSATAQLEAR